MVETGDPEGATVGEATPGVVAGPAGEVLFMYIGAAGALDIGRGAATELEVGTGAALDMGAGLETGL